MLIYPLIDEVETHIIYPNFITGVYVSCDANKTTE